MERLNRSMTAGCLTTLILLIIIGISGLSWLWYANWHAGKVNSERRHQAASAILQQARTTAVTTAHALNAGPTRDTGKLTEEIWRHTGSPLITYDATHQTFRARLSKQVAFETVRVLPGGGSDAVNRCLDFTYSRTDDHMWTPKVFVQKNDVCRPATDIGYLSRLASTRIQAMDERELSRTAVQKSLDPTGQLRTFTVKSVSRAASRATVTILITSHDRTTDQCYRITRPTTASSGIHPPVTSMPQPAC
ncbi:hypothetical protein ACFY2T_41420 [Streptomyces sp. NPDC001260]|uniref:hypothetical protein n=1 Tax=Streptomyces sp. NPDC001260 TaxID=3364551 RepID=UPI00369F2C43